MSASLPEIVVRFGGCTLRALPSWFFAPTPKRLHGYAGPQSQPELSPRVFAHLERPMAEIQVLVVTFAHARRQRRCRKRAWAASPRGGAGLSRADTSAYASFDQVILPSLLALNADQRAVGGLHVGVPVQRHPDRKTGRRVASNDLNAGNGLKPRVQVDCSGCE